MKKNLCLVVRQVVQEKERCREIERQTETETDKVKTELFAEAENF